jgi:hypothetical protein
MEILKFAADRVWLSQRVMAVASPQALAVACCLVLAFHPPPLQA